MKTKMISRGRAGHSVWLTLILGIALFGLVACATTNSAADNGATGGKSGSDLWAERCSFCHNLRSPASLSDVQWNVAVRHMRERAQLTGEEETKIRTFLQAGN